MRHYHADLMRRDIRKIMDVINIIQLLQCSLNKLTSEYGAFTPQFPIHEDLKFTVNALPWSDLISITGPLPNNSLNF